MRSFYFFYNIAILYYRFWKPSYQRNATSFDICSFCNKEVDPSGVMGPRLIQVLGIVVVIVTIHRPQPGIPHLIKKEILVLSLKIGVERIIVLGDLKVSFWVNLYQNHLYSITFVGMKDIIMTNTVKFQYLPQTKVWGWIAEYICHHPPLPVILEGPTV